MLIRNSLQNDLLQVFKKFLLKWYLKCNCTGNVKIKKFAFKTKGQIKPSATLEQESIQESLNTAKFL